MKDMRKFWLTLAGVVSFTSIALVNHAVEPMSLGLGLGFLLAPMAAANAMEHRFKNGAKE